MTHRTSPVLFGHEPLSFFGPYSSVVGREVDGVIIFDLSGPLVGEHTVLAFLDAVQTVLKEGTKNIAVNLADVPVADSYGIGGLANAYKWVHGAGGEIKLFGVSGRLDRTFRRLRLDTVFEICDDEPSAVASFRVRT